MEDSRGLSTPMLAAPRARVLIDNDFGGDPDGLFQLAHHLLCPSIEVRGIIGSFFTPGSNFGASPAAADACTAAKELMECMGLTGHFQVFTGADSGLVDMRTPVVTPGAEAIIEEAMRDDSPLPLYIACGAGLTDVASAWLMEPRIAQRLTLVWIGGPEPSGAAPPAHRPVEYNLGIDVAAAQVVFNRSDIPIWQVPASAYRQALVSHAELRRRLAPCGRTGRFLAARLEDFLARAKNTGIELGVTYVLGDSPLVLLTALQCAFDPDTSSCTYTMLPAPTISGNGASRENPYGRRIRVYSRLDTRLLFEDFFSTLEQAASSQ